MRFTLALATLLAASPLAHAADPAQRGKILFLRCAACHAITENSAARIGPNLHGVVGRKVASLPGYSYSAALKSQNFVWDTAHLNAWLTRPAGLVPGTAMAFAGLPAEADRQAIIAYLAAQK